MCLPELIALLCQAWLLSSRAALIERRGRVIVGPAQHIALLRAFRSGPSRTISRTDPAHEVGHGVANLVGAILLEEMAPFHRHFGLVQPGAAKFPLPADQNRTWIRIDEQLRDLGRGEPSAIVFDHLHHIRGLTLDRNHSWPRERGPAVLARSNEGLTVSGHFRLTELAYDGVRQHSFNKHVLFKDHLL